MIRGYFAVRGTTRRPVVDAVFHFPGISRHTFKVRLLVDTGADRTVIAPLDAKRLERELRLDLTTVPKGHNPARALVARWRPEPLRPS